MGDIEGSMCVCRERGQRGEQLYRSPFVDVAFALAAPLVSQHKARARICKLFKEPRN
jgi:hypothetical protein